MREWNRESNVMKRERECVTCVSFLVLETLKTWRGAAEMVKKRLLYLCEDKIGRKLNNWIYS